MPLIKSGTKEAVSKNISEFHTGKTYAHTKAKFGKARADAQAIAAALSTARRYGKKKAFGGPNIESMIMRGSSYKLGHEGMINSSIPGRTDKLPMNVKAGSYVLPADIPSALGQGNTLAGGQILKKMFSSGPYGLPTMRGSSRVQQPRLSMRPPSLPGSRRGMFQAGGTPTYTQDDMDRLSWAWRPRTPNLERYGQLSDQDRALVGAIRQDRAAQLHQQLQQEGLLPPTGQARGGKADDDSHVPIIAAGGEYIIDPEVVRDIGHGNIKAGHKVLDAFVLHVRKKHIETLKKLPGPKK